MTDRPFLRDANDLRNRGKFQADLWPTAVRRGPGDFRPKATLAQENNGFQHFQPTGAVNKAPS